MTDDYNDQKAVIDFHGNTTNNGIIDVQSGSLSIYHKLINNNEIRVYEGSIDLHSQDTASTLELINQKLINMQGNLRMFIPNEATFINEPGSTIDISGCKNLYILATGNFIMNQNSTLVLPKQVKHKAEEEYLKPIILNGNEDCPVYIQISANAAYAKDLNQTNEKLFEEIKEATSFEFSGNTNDVKFSTIDYKDGSMNC
ncbi:MAG: hypothetical protein IJ481_01545 [Alphaproteobacteria bacterium]|nr:hypothetical protein [Alphaproteobacteria bacterium]